MTFDDLNALLVTPEGGSLDHSKTIQKLKAGKKPVDVAAYQKQYEPLEHDTMDPVKRRDKEISTPDPEFPNEAAKNKKSTVKVNRLSLSLQKIITSRAVSFLFGNPVKIVCDAQSEDEKQVLKALNRIYYDNKINSFNRRLAREMFRSTEVAEYWFPVKRDHSDYGFKSDYKIKCALFSPWDGSDLYPLFDDIGDLIAFSREYVLVDEEGKKTTVFETYTATEILVWSKRSDQDIDLIRSQNRIGKIPVVYGKQEQVEWADVQTAIDRLEYLLSNFADTNDYHAAPKIFIEGKILGFSSKGEPGGIIEGTPGSKASYLSWNHATEAVKLEIETLLRIIYSFTQTPDISFDSVKGLREISGEALKMLFLDAHLKVMEKREVHDEMQQRRINIIKPFIGVINKKLKDVADTLEIEADIQPFIINDQKALIDLLSEATGGAQLLSAESAVGMTGLVDDASAEFKKIQAEADQAQERAKINLLDPATI